ncbi:hypothetical protein B0T25DRAFT_590091 [Lasiosphaeria hispida]|uniref:Uncharacterized protein n=1 Tax=Lasiosphaeria hispida TaxID=260671 RepID=A0AAJ0HNB2_9PEZI|nr:hypothetical protein B0T25DRAFT_590091 [Lasiosphaeria hispida]
MLVRDTKRLGLLIGPLFVLLITSFSLWDSDTKTRLQSHLGAAFHGQISPTNHDQVRVQTPSRAPTSAPTRPAPALSHYPPHPHLDPPSPPPLQTPQAGPNRNNAKPALSPPTHQELSSVSAKNKSFFPVLFGNTSAFNTNILPHPARDDTWSSDPAAPSAHFFEVVCTAAFAVADDGASVLQCLEPLAGDPQRCEGELALLALSAGPHDALVFYRPGRPYVWREELVYVLRAVVRRPGGYGRLEKNWFVFWGWDGEGGLCAIDVVPKRVFAWLDPSGNEEATNSLRVTMCERADVACKPDGEDTFILTVVQHKWYYNYHSEYEPYVIVFRERAPFEVRGQKYHGYLDDELFLAFGMEDERGGGIDVRASDLLGEMGLCSDP